MASKVLIIVLIHREDNTIVISNAENIFKSLFSNIILT
jgi:hypothetical protein